MENDGSSSEVVDADLRQVPIKVAADFGANIRALRKLRNWSQDDLAAAMKPFGITMQQVTVARIENASRPTSVGEVAVLSRIFGVSVSELFEDPEERRYLEDLDEQNRESLRLALESEITKLEHDVARLRVQVDAGTQAVEARRHELVQAQADMSRRLDDLRMLEGQLDQTMRTLAAWQAAEGSGDDGEH